jgi:uncharacterized protein (TIGR03437 family)
MEGNLSFAMRRSGLLVVCVAALFAPAVARHAVSLCGTEAETGRERLFLHRQAVRARQRSGASLTPKAAAAESGNRDIGNIAILDDADGVVARQNEFNLDAKTLTFTPAGNPVQYRYAVTDGGYDPASANGTPLAALDDDDTREVKLPFSFPFYGAVYDRVYVNSDGNLTFTTGDSASSARSLGRTTAGPPRIAPLFDDLDPSVTAGGVRVLSGDGRVVVSWVNVPEWTDYGSGRTQTFQVTLYADGRVSFAYSGAAPTNAIVGLAPGNLKGSASLVDFRNDASGSYAAAVVERFGDTLDVDIVTAAQKFYQTHEDSYDYLVFFNNMGIDALGGEALAYETTVRSSGSGYGVAVGDEGSQYGSASRLLSVVNMAQLGNYPANPSSLVPLRASSGDTPLTAMAHEAGHLFLAFASVQDPADPTAKPMLGYQNAHWSFAFNSEASLLEGERIADRGEGTSPRFMTTDTVQGYSPLDQYLMGFRPPEGVPATFLVTGVPAGMTQWHPLRNYGFNGGRRDIAIEEVMSAMGRRTPDSSVAQRRFRFAFILVVAQGSQPSAADLAKVDGFRQQFESFFAQAASNNAVADTSLKRSLKLSLFPSAGVLPDVAVTATAAVETAPVSDLTIELQAPGGYASVPASVRIPAGARTASFPVTGVRAGVQELTAVPDEGSYETAAARVQVGDASLLKLVAVSGDQQVAPPGAALPEPIVVRLTDANNLAYAGAKIRATPSADGSVSSPVVTTDARGQASVGWTPGTADANELHLTVEAVPSVGLTLRAGSAVPVITAVVNAASFEAGVAPGALATIFGAKLADGRTAAAAYPWPSTLAGVRVQVGYSFVPVSYVSDGQINFYIPEDTPYGGTATVTVITSSGAKTAIAVEVKPVQPGIFPGAVLRAGTGESAVTTPVRAGDYIEIYCTGLGLTSSSGGLQRTVLTPVVFIGAVPVKPVYSGLAPGYQGLYQVDVQVPAGLAPGTQSLLLSVSLAHSNEVAIGVQ